MQRGNRSPLHLAALCCMLLLLSSCAQFRTEPHEVQASLPAIVLSVSAGSLYVVDPTTGSHREIVADLPDFQSGYGAWSPDRRRLAFGRNGIFVLDPASNRQRPIVEGTGLSMPAWSPDGRQLAYSDGLGIWITGLAAVRPRRVRVPAVLAPLALAWSPGPRIVFEGLDLDCSPVVRCVSTGTSDIWTIRSDGTGLSRLTDVDHAESPKWSPDGTRIVYVRHYEGAARPSEVWEVSGTGFDQRRLIAVKDVVAADWSPDGSMLAIVRGAPRGQALQLWIGRPDGSGLRRVAEVPGTHATIDW